MRKGIGGFELTSANTVIVALNVIVFLWLSVLGDTTNAQFMYEHGASYWVNIFQGHEYYRLLTCTFIHFGFTHLLNNMIVLAYIGDNLERALGTVKYVILYLIAAIGSSFVSAFWSMMQHSRAVSGGASGAIFGVVGALFVIVMKNRGHLEDISSRRLGLFAVLSIYYGITSAGTDNISHISGCLIGAIAALILYRKKRSWS